MATQLFYLTTYKNVPILFEKIAAAKVPNQFNRDFLKDTIGLKGSNDRPMIPMLRYMGFLDQSGAPTPEYRLLKGSKEQREAAIAAAIKKAYRPLFDANQDANELTGDKLKALVGQVAGTDEDLTTRISGTFSQLVRLGDFKAEALASKQEKTDKEDEEEEQSASAKNESGKGRGFRSEFHYNIQIHLPANGTEEVYLNIFNALRKTFQ